MRELKECTAEVFRRSEKRISKRRQTRSRVLAWCIPLCLIVTLWSVVILPAMMPAGSSGAMAPEGDSLAEGAYPPTQQTADIPGDGAGSETTLEFWITEDVKDVDWSGHDEIFGWMGAREFLGKGYKKITGEDGTDGKPTHYVSYVITAYPDYADGGEFVTGITVTDPDVKVYGLTVDSTFEEFDSVFEALGFALSDGKGAIPSRIAEKDGIKFRLDKPTAENADSIPALHISAEVTNRQGIVF